MQNRSWRSLGVSMNRCPTGSGSRRRRAGSAASHEVDDLDLVAVADQRGGKRVALDDHHVVFDGYAAGIDVQPFEQLLHGHRLLQIIRVPVERNTHGRGLDEFYSTESEGGMKTGAETFGSFGTAERPDRSERIYFVVVVGVVSSSSSLSSPSSCLGPCIRT